MIKKYVYGNPIETGAVVNPVEASTDPIQYLGELEMNGKTIFNYEMESDDIVYGLGEANGGLNKRGRIYRSFCSDDRHQHQFRQCPYQPR